MPRCHILGSPILSSINTMITITFFYNFVVQTVILSSFIFWINFPYAYVQFILCCYTKRYLPLNIFQKRWKEYTEELYKKDLHNPDNHDSVITHLEPDILECEVNWALRSITRNKASGGDGIPVELFQILRDDAVKLLHSICQQIWKTQQWPQDWKGSVFIPIPKKDNAKECSNYCTIALISHASKVVLKIVQGRLQQYVNHELPDVQAGFRKRR